jgi:hypothetical protein
MTGTRGSSVPAWISSRKLPILSFILSALGFSAAVGVWLLTSPGLTAACSPEEAQTAGCQMVSVGIAAQLIRLVVIVAAFGAVLGLVVGLISAKSDRHRSYLAAVLGLAIAHAFWWVYGVGVNMSGRGLGALVDVLVGSLVILLFDGIPLTLVYAIVRALRRVPSSAGG